jgi:hypothetical protein
MLQIIRIEQARSPNKKYLAVYNDGTEVEFGHPDYLDYTQHRDDNRKRLYLARSLPMLERIMNQKSTEEFVRSPVFLSYFVTWSSKSLNQGIRNANKVIYDLNK